VLVLARALVRLETRTPR